MDDRHFESLRLNEDNAKKGDVNGDLRLKAADLDKEIEVLKLQRQDNWREIARAKDMNSRFGNDGALLRRDTDKQVTDLYELRKENEF